MSGVMSGGMAASIRQALVVAMAGDAGLGALLHNFSDAEPERGVVPYGFVGEAASAPWGAKDRPGEELRIDMSFVDRGDGDRIDQIAAMAVAVIEAMPRTIDGWETSGFVLLRRRSVTLRGGQRRATLTWRVRGWRAQ